MAPRKPKDTDTKTASPRKTKAAAPQPDPVPPTMPALTAADPAEAKATPVGLKLKELIESVAESTGGKRSEVKPVVEATLSALGAALAAGLPLTVPPLGKLRVVKSKGPALTLKLRPAGAAKAAGLALADDAEDG